VKLCTKRNCRPEKDLESHEALCRHCGRCCHHKLILGELVVSLDELCRYLDTTTNLCTVYLRAPKRMTLQGSDGR